MFENDREAYLEEIEANRKKGIEMPPAPPPYTSLQVRLEMLKEVLFLTPPVLLAVGSALLALFVPRIDTFWTTAPSWLTGLLGAILGACVGGFVVWLFRILGTLAFGRLAMGLGDVHLMLGVGAIVGAGAATVAFFLAPFAGLAIAVWRLLTKGRRELPFGPYLSLATAVGLLFYCDIAAYLTPGLEGLTALLMGNGAGGR
jgi:leader peptidase (prepilin peptidase)/N-methyltransferase